VTRLQVQSVNQKHLRVSGISPLLAGCLHELPRILELRDNPAARARLLPPPTSEDVVINQEWKESVEPDLRHLLVSAGEIISRDLTGLKPSQRLPDCCFVTFPTTHTSAWMSALNQARLILAALANVDEIDMNLPYSQLKGEKVLAVIQISVFGELLDRFVQRELKPARKRKSNRPQPKRRKGR
jgi:Domain of unknown function (DUF2017)